MMIGDLVRDETGAMGLVLGWYCATRGYAYIYYFDRRVSDFSPETRERLGCAIGMPIQESYLEVVSACR